jgi:hypothetical protein
MVSPLLLTGPKGPRFFFNIDGNVGPKSPNRTTDVQLVQLGYLAMLQNPANQSVLTTAERQAYANISPGAKYSGSPSDPLSLAIRAHEASRGGTQDGHVSAMKNSAFYDAHHFFMVAALNNSLRDVMQGDYPRIDKHKKCPIDLRNSVLSILLGR